MAIKNNLTDQEIIDHIKYVFEHYYFGDIKKILDARLPIAGFILGSCFIEHMACFCYAAEGTKKRYIDFVDTYLKPQNILYNGKTLYENLRNNLVHNYTSNLKHTVDLDVSFEGKKSHLQTTSNLTPLSLTQFVDHLRKAMQLYFQDVDRNGSQIRQNTLRRYKATGIFHIDG